ncbi:MAG: septum formation protein Maf [Spirochaetaceae bacterium]|nr:septum formation protein Maf [Spirochaetaceae bacterium]
MEPIILASGSLRRQEILKMMGIPFKVVIPEIPEELDDSNISAEEFTEKLAANKVKWVTKLITATQEVPWVLGADTVISLNNKIYGKPSDMNQATQFLQELSGKKHKVVTSLALYNGKLHDFTTRTSVTHVTFSKLSKEEIDWYVATDEWHNAAGGYRIQGFASYFIKKIEGTNSSVVGLPLFELYDMLKEQGYSLINE